MKTYYVAGIPFNGDNSLMHHGTKGQKWGLRKYQNEDGSLTALGRIHYGIGKARESVGNSARSVASRIKDNMNRRAQEKRLQKLREHPDRMTKEELKEDLERTKILEEMKNVQKRIREIENLENKNNERSKTRDEIFEKDYKKMTSEELKVATERLIAEKNYETALRSLNSEKYKGVKKFVGDSLSSFGKKLVDKSTDKFIEKMFGDKELDASKRARSIAENWKFVRDSVPVKEVLKIGNLPNDATNKEIEKYKNRLIDLKQIKYLENELESGLYDTKEKTDSYKSTDRDSEANKQNGGKNNKKKGNK